MKEFYPNDNKRLHGIVIQKTKTLHVHECERICKLYAECFAFNMNWSDKDRLEGDCELLEHRKDDQFFYRKYEPDVISTFFGELLALLKIGVNNSFHY